MEEFWVKWRLLLRDAVWKNETRNRLYSKERNKRRKWEFNRGRERHLETVEERTRNIAAGSETSARWGEADPAFQTKPARDEQPYPVPLRTSPQPPRSSTRVAGKLRWDSDLSKGFHKGKHPCYSLWLGGQWADINLRISCYHWIISRNGGANL